MVLYTEILPKARWFCDQVWNRTFLLKSLWKLSSVVQKKVMLCKWSHCIVRGVFPVLCLSMYIFFHNSQPTPQFNRTYGSAASPVAESVQFCIMGWNSKEKPGAILEAVIKIQWNLSPSLLLGQTNISQSCNSLLEAETGGNTTCTFLHHLLVASPSTDTPQTGFTILLKPGWIHPPLETWDHHYKASRFRWGFAFQKKSNHSWFSIAEPFLQVF